MDRFFQQVGQIPEAVCEAEEHDVILELVSLGFGVAVMPELVTGREKDIRAIPSLFPEMGECLLSGEKKKRFPLQAGRGIFCVLQGMGAGMKGKERAL